ncbi:MAG: hypothetical protein J0I40_00425 [Cellulomonas sp.]|uniref:hypothetical protein n=1 Tax=Cellulomonas sp. 73-92 TaxID=1895740 RepID=UPI00092BB8A0|nr:hypothetical protein [Cellulomonas sp. 73-92]MBN9373864.1 hypothetical protein [Cellulomonas sp.]OJV79687.1 MAG: hypothetical protein BGO37_12125 [Cellulomonas sp. 73-92]
MLVAAALIPDTALLVPGAGGVADRGATLRAAALTALRDVTRHEGRVVVVAPGRSDRRLGPWARASLGAAGVPDELVGWPPPALERPAPTMTGPVAGISASAALLLLAHDGVAAADVVEVGPAEARPGRGGELRDLGRELADEGPTTMVVVGSASGRHGPDAPLADDERAPAYDEQVVADLADAGPAARARLGSLDRVLAGELAVTGWGPWQVLLGALGADEVVARRVHREVLAGATHAVLTWVAAG